MRVRENYKYTRTHQWLSEEGGSALVGITDYAQEQLGGIVFVSLPEEGEAVTAGRPFAEVESAKVVSEVHSPVSGIVCEVNEALADEPDMANEDPYGAWFVRVEGITARAELLSAAEYSAYVEGLLAGGREGEG